MSLASDSRRSAQKWFDLAERFPSKEREAALEIAEAWFQLAVDAASLEITDAIAKDDEDSFVSTSRPFL